MNNVYSIPEGSRGGYSLTVKKARKLALLAGTTALEHPDLVTPEARAEAKTQLGVFHLIINAWEARQLEEGVELPRTFDGLIRELEADASEESTDGRVDGPLIGSRAAMECIYSAFDRLYSTANVSAEIFEGGDHPKDAS